MQILGQFLLVLGHSLPICRLKVISYLAFVCSFAPRSCWVIKAFYLRRCGLFWWVLIRLPVCMVGLAGELSRAFSPRYFLSVRSISVDPMLFLFALS